MGKLHEILAVEGDLEGVAKKVMLETVNTFSKKPDHFQGFDKTYNPFREGVEHQLPSENKELVTTVGDKLDYAFTSISNWLNVVAEKERTNQNACADIVIDGVVIAKEVPATFLLGMEKKLVEIRNMLSHVPTLSPGVKWELDTQLGKGVYKSASQSERLRTERKMSAVVLYDATDKHPAQVKEMTEDVVIGKYVQTDWSSMVSPAEKSALMGRTDKLIQAVKKARQRANEAEIVVMTIGNTMSDYILNK